MVLAVVFVAVIVWYFVQQQIPAPLPTETAPRKEQTTSLSPTLPQTEEQELESLDVGDVETDLQDIERDLQGL